MEYSEKLEKLRSDHYYCIIFLFIGDILTTTIGINLGHDEKNSLMIPFVQNPIIFIIIKMIAIVSVIFFFEWVIKTLKECHRYGYTIQYILILGFSIIALYNFYIVIGNLIVIFFGSIKLSMDEFSQ